ncbi:MULTISPECIES: primase-like DNA-binding domain-containing protein [unclassified Arthrobacter]|uniref:primase-like DNA-binding domain-containing protein n=1 Tax=unclassified Arthrobacter TaxID=235627 RepID=UPI000CE2CA79|nr:MULTISPECIES: primase-like DNA-binding domain-containing protein [unclassified Arthrobacter]
MTAMTGTTPADRTGNAKTAEDRVRQFLAVCTVRDLDDSAVLPVADLYGMFIIWCEQNSTDPLSIQLFSKVLRDEGIEVGLQRREKVVKGIMVTGQIPIQYILETDKAPGPNSVLGALPA